MKAPTVQSRMRDQFIGYVRPTDNDFETLWRNCFFSFDTNILLHIFRYNQSVVEQFFSIVDALSSRVWISHQVAFEFYRNWQHVDASSRREYNVILEGIQADISTTNKRYNNLKRFDLLDVKITEEIEKFLVNLVNIISKCKEERPSVDAAFDLLQKLEEIIGENSGEKFSDEELKKMYSEGAARYEKKIPPGYTDIKKPEPDRYGDYINWQSLIAHSKVIEKPLIFVCDEDKEDFWNIESGKKTGPRSELIQEFLSKTGERLYIYSFANFIKFASQHLGIEVDKSIIEDIERSDEARQSATQEDARESRALEPPKENEISRLQEKRRQLIDLYNRSMTTQSQLGQQLADLAGQMTRNPELRSVLEPAINDLQRNLQAMQAGALTLFGDLEINAQKIERAAVLGI